MELEESCVWSSTVEAFGPIDRLIDSWRRMCIQLALNVHPYRTLHLTNHFCILATYNPFYWNLNASEFNYKAFHIDMNCFGNNILMYVYLNDFEVLCIIYS